MVYSASIATAEGSRFTGHSRPTSSCATASSCAIGLIAAVVVFQVPLRVWQQGAPWLFLLGVALLVLVLMPHVGREVNGARRWLPLGLVNLQPSELMKLFAVLYAADYTVRKLPTWAASASGFVPMALVMALVGGCCCASPTSAPSSSSSCIAMGILFLGGINGGCSRAAVPLLAAASSSDLDLSPYRRERIFGFMDPWSDRLRQGLPAVARADRLRPRRVVRRRPRRERREAVLPARRRTPTSCWR
jgi:cell division protein FtsW